MKAGHRLVAAAARRYCLIARAAPLWLFGRCGALLPLFRLVGVPCIAALWRVEKPTASPRRSPETQVKLTGTCSISVARSRMAPRDECAKCIKSRS